MKFEAILFDCDGVLVDSEPITNGVLRDMLAESGWALTAEDCMRIFIGRTVRSEAARIEAHTGRPLTDEWMAEFYARRNARLSAELQAIDGALDAVRTVHARLVTAWNPTSTGCCAPSPTAATTWRATS